MRKLFSFFVAFLLSATSFAAVSYELNGGVQSEWENPQAMYNELNTIWNTFSATKKVWGNLEELKANVVQGIPTQASNMDLKFIADDNFKAKFEWLVTYMDAKCTEQGQTLPSTNAPFLRYNLQAFFIDGVRASWPHSADYASCGVSTLDAYQPYWKSSFVNPTNPTEEVTLWAPYKEGATFDGWYWNEDFSGDKVTTINAESNGTLYAKWGDYVPTIVEVHALADSTETKTIGVVNFISGRNVWIQDASAGILVYTAETPSCKVGDKITVKGKKVIYGGAPEIAGAVIEATEAGELYDIVEYENLAALVADSLEHKYFATRVTVPGVIIVEYDSYNNPIVEDDLGNKAKCYKMVLDPTVYPVGTKVTVTAVAAWFNEFQFVGDAKNIVIPVAGVKENYTYPVRDGKYTLENNWVISNIEDNFAANKPGSTDYVRGMAAKDGIMYFINRETESLVRVDGETGKMLEPLKLQGEHLFEVQEEDGTWKSGVTYAFNDIKFDQAGNCLIGACITGASKCQTFFIYKVNLETGVCTLLIDDVLWENPGLDREQFRFDAFGVAGDVTKNGVIMAADAKGSWNVYRWLITDGKAGEGKRVAAFIDPAFDQSLFVNASGFGTAPQIFPQNEDGTLFYVDGNNTLPMLFYGSPEEGALLVDDFIHVPTGVKVWNNGNDTISMNPHFNGLVEFQVGEEYFLLMVATNNEHAGVKSFYALYKFADADRMFSGMEPLWYFPHNGLGSQTNGCRTAPVSVEVVDDHTAKLYLYAVNNGYASYTFSLLPANITVTSNNTTMGTVSGSGVYDIGDNAVITAIPKGGYLFSHWDDGNTQNPRVVKVTEDKTYTAYFDKNTYSITKQYDAEQGSITGPTSGKYLDVITLTATPKYGYHFTQWSDGNTDNPRSFVLTKDTTFAAFFTVNQYQLSTSSNNPEAGTVSGAGTYDYNTYAEISAAASYGYHFVQWNDGNSVNPRQVQVTKDKTYTAYFDKNTYYITKNYDSNQGYINGSSSGEYLDNITLTAEANYGYHFVQWSDGNTENPRSLILTQDTTYTAEFAPNKYTITTVSSDTQRGTTQGDTTVNYLEYITISAAASYGYHFVQWNDGNSVNPRQVQVTKDMTYSAYFDKNTYAISLSCNEGQGRVEGVTSAEYLDKVTILATANYGYHFAQWSDGVTDNPRTFVITQDTTFSAEFAQSFSGQCGDNLYWVYANDTLTITGTGAMYDERPWGLLVDKIQKIVLPAGITHIGNDAFKDCMGLRDIDLPYTLETIGDYSFNGCRRLITINCYPLLPPIAESTSFSNYSANLYAPCDNLEEYKYDMVFGQFKYFECIGSESVSTNGTVVTPGSTDVTITWPTDENADTYTIVIMKGDVIFCKLLFNKEGQLLNIAFAPGRDGQNRAVYAAQTANGLRFTVTGLEEKTKYGYDVSSQDEEDNTISSYTGEFTTQSNVTTNIDNVPSTNPRVQKILLNGQLYILREGKTYSVLGQEIDN